MAFYESYDPHARYRPLTVIGGYPLYLIQVLVLVHTAGMVATAMFLGFGGNVYARLFLLDTDKVLVGQIWRLFTYAYVDGPSIWFVIAMLIIFFGVGKEVEQYVGRRVVLVLYAAMILLPSLLLTATAALMSVRFMLGGSMAIMFGFFIAFCVLYPGVTLSFFFFQVSMKMAGWILLGINTLMYISAQAWSGLFDLWMCSAIAFMGLKWIGVQGGFGRLTEWMESRRLERQAKRQKLKVLRRQERERSIDEILDKISKQGIGSLTPEERATLERARTDLMKRDGGE